MAAISLEHVAKTYPNGVEVIADLSLEVGDGEFMVLVGPSGCGKTTALRMVAGLERISKGTVKIGGRVVNSVSPKDRDIAMVFQNYALYPHMTVEQNIGFSLKLKKLPRNEVNKKVLDTIELLGLSECTNRKPLQLSGGRRRELPWVEQSFVNQARSLWMNHFRTSMPSFAFKCVPRSPAFKNKLGSRHCT